MISLTSKQKGIFSIEFAIVGVIFSLLFVFSGDVISKLSFKGKLDRLSFSMVNILKERTQLYSDDYAITQEQVDLLVDISSQSLGRTIRSFDSASFGYVFESVTFDSDNNPTLTSFSQSGSGISCTVGSSLLSYQHLSKVTTWNRQTSLYRVTFCYNTDNWIGDLLGREFRRVQSDAVMIGR